MKNTKTNAANARIAAKNGQIKEEIKNLILGKLGVIGIIGLLFMAGIGTVSAGSLNVWTDAQNHIWVENDFLKWDVTHGDSMIVKTGVSSKNWRLWNDYFWANIGVGKVDYYKSRVSSLNNFTVAEIIENNEQTVTIYLQSNLSWSQTPDTVLVNTYLTFYANSGLVKLSYDVPNPPNNGNNPPSLLYNLFITPGGDKQNDFYYYSGSSAEHNFPHTSWSSFSASKLVPVKDDYIYITEYDKSASQGFALVSKKIQTQDFVTDINYGRASVGGEIYGSGDSIQIHMDPSIKGTMYLYFYETNPTVAYKPVEDLIMGGIENIINPPCTNECSPSGTKSCNDSTHYKTCGDYDSDDCLEWSNKVSCGSGKVCEGNGNCVSVPVCESGQTQNCIASNGCSGIKSCVNGQFGDCTTNLQKCDTNCDGTPETCQETCELCICTNGQTQSCTAPNGCEESQTCVNGQFGDCTTNLQKCDDGTCKETCPEPEPPGCTADDCIGITYFQCKNGKLLNKGLVDGKCGYTHEPNEPEPLPMEDASVDVTMHITFDRTKPGVDESFELRANFVNMDFKPRKAYLTVFLPSGVDILEGFGKVKSMAGGAATYELNLDGGAGMNTHTMRLKANEEGKKAMQISGIVIDENGGQHVIQQKSETITVVGETQGGGTEITCNPPYIQVGNECCVDSNYNKICDRDDTPDEPKTNWLIYIIAGIGALIILLLIAVLVKR
ncbi:MAG: hypothetical protein A7315_12095 [Candidatus Altiarchaeales archaeon WOR_SM1_79]|nr:MAG: hypothetical protein A7315_12095 [Candidatus Altiarchaeales archaeon WOR_SM1_79]